MILSSISASSAFVTNAVVFPAASAAVIDSEGGVNADVTVGGGGRGEGGRGGNGGVIAVYAKGVRGDAIGEGDRYPPDATEEAAALFCCCC